MRFSNLQTNTGKAAAVQTGRVIDGLHSARSTFRRKVAQLLLRADIVDGGERPWDIRVHEPRFYTRILATGSLGLGESYMDGWWDCDRLDEFFNRLLRADLWAEVNPWTELIDSFKTKIYNLQKPSRAFEVARHHYDIGNEIYEKMLDKNLIYSCGHWKDATTLDEAQEAKLELICAKLALKPGMLVLDIGCGWGGTAKFMAERYGVEVVGITVSEQQAGYAENLCRGLPVSIRLMDYRKLTGRFDRILSIGMFEHVGYKNYSSFMEIVRQRLKNNGLFLLHTIGGNRAVTKIDPWINKYIFPNAMLPSPKQISGAIEGRFVLEDWHNFGVDYDKTLMCWFANFHANWQQLKHKYDRRFYRMWKYYLLTCAGSFRARDSQLWQIVLSPRGVPGGYRCPR